MLFDSGGLEILDLGECRALLNSTGLGRIVFTDRALPAVQPVNFVLDGQDVIIRTAAGSRMAAAVRNAIVAFEIDDFDVTHRSGWSVVLVGRARCVREPEELAHLQSLGLDTWVPGDRDEFIRITPEIITGRRIPLPVGTV